MYLSIIYSRYQQFKELISIIDDSSNSSNGG